MKRARCLAGAVIALLRLRRSADVDGLFREQAAETDRKKREAILHRIQQLMCDRAIFVPLFEPAFLNGYGQRVVESGLGLITYHGYSARTRT